MSRDYSGRDYSDSEIKNKLDLWASLSCLYLDTDVSLFFDDIARTVKQSQFSIEEAEHILRWEVRPAFYCNLLNTAGEWQYWDHEEVLTFMQRARQKPPLFMWLPLRKITRNWHMPEPEWAEILKRI